MPGLTRQQLNYVSDPFSRCRFPTREVMVGDVGIGGSNPIRLQSMTIADTMDTEATVAEAIALFRAGAEIVRITAPGPADAENLANIKRRLVDEGFDFPLVADIHFAPKAALIAVEHVEKVRINPGNYADRKKFQVREYSDDQYADELGRVRESFLPLVRRARELRRVLRIGTNHGSLSDRIMNRFGDTPEGMVESALEFIRICRDEDFHDIVVSMKASNPRVMVQAYRMLVARFRAEGLDYPLHLGVTEAGDGVDGRMKSAVGIGALLEDGIGDTIRVSLTEDAIYELPAAERIARPYQGAATQPETTTAESVLIQSYQNAVSCFDYRRLATGSVRWNELALGGQARPALFLTLAPSETASASALVARGADAFLVAPPEFDANTTLPDGDDVHLLAGSERLAWTDGASGLPSRGVLTLRADQADFGLTAMAPQLSQANRLILTLDPRSIQEGRLLHDYRRLVAQLARLVREGLLQEMPPLLLRASYENPEEALYRGAIEIGGLLIDGIGDAVLITVPGQPAAEALQFGLDLLQSVRLRLSKTEFISCPSCGRTLFDLQTTTARIKERTAHLKGVKIAVMGCIVNGPGEMADADFGYVGAGPGKIHLYHGKDLVKANIPTSEAVDELIGLIRDHGLWSDPSD